MADSLKNLLAGTHGNVAADAADVAHVVSKSMDISLPDMAATGTVNVLCCKAQTGLIIRSATLYPAAALTANDTNYRTFDLGTSATAAGTITSIDSIATTTGDTGNFVARTAQALSIATDDSDKVDEGEFLWLQVTAAGTGVAVIGGAVLHIEYVLSN